MRVCFCRTLVLGLAYVLPFVFPNGAFRIQTEEVRIGDDSTTERFKPRRWSETRDGPYQMVVSGRQVGRVALPVIPDIKEEPAKKTEKPSTTKPSTTKPDTKEKPTDRPVGEWAESIAATTKDSLTEKYDKVTQRIVLKPGRKRNQQGEVGGSRKQRRNPAPNPVTTANPHTMSYNLYNHFRPLEQDVPRDHILPFLDFGRKLTTGPPPNVMNSIESSSSTRTVLPEETSEKEMEDFLNENMDMSVMRKAVERNTVPRGMLQMKDPVIFKKRIQSLTTKSSDCNTTYSTSTIHPLLKKLMEKRNSSKLNTGPCDPHITIQTVGNKTAGSLNSSIGIFDTLNKTDLLAHHVDLQSNESRTKAQKVESPLKSNSTKIHAANVTIVSNSKSERDPKTSTTDMMSNNTTSSSNNTLPKPNPTAKVLSTAVVTSVSVKEAGASFSGNISDSTESRNSSSIPSRERELAGKEHKIRRPENSTRLATILNLRRENYTPYIIHHNKTKLFPTTLRPKPSFRPVTFRSMIRRNFTKPKPPVIRVISTPHSYIEVPKIVSSLERNSSAPTTTSAALGTIFVPMITTTIPTSTSPTPIPTEDKTIPLSSTTSTTTTTTTTTPTPSTTTKLQTTSISTTTTPPSTTTTTTTPPTTTTSTTPEPTTTSVKTSTISPKSSTIIYRRTSSSTKSTTIVTTKSTSSTSSTSAKVSTFPETEQSTKKSMDAELPLTFSTPHESSIDKISLVNLQQDNLPDTGLKTEIGINPSSEATTPVLMSQNEDVEHKVNESSILENYNPQDNIGEDEVTYVEFKPLGEQPHNSSDRNLEITTTQEIDITHSPVIPNETVSEKAVVKEDNATTHKNPGVMWVYNQKNWTVTKSLDSVDVVYTDTLGVATYVLAVLGIVPLLLGAFVIIRQLIMKRKKKVLDESEYSSEYNRSPLPTKLPRLPAHLNWEAEKLPVVPTLCKRWEFSREKLRLQTLLGQGNFGQVWKAEADDISGHEGLTRLVAVKTVKEGANLREKEDLLRELGIMQDLGAHPNVVTLLGCCTEKEPYLLIMEYVMYGKLLAFLREHRTRAHYFNFSDLASALTSRDLTVFAYCVARGMEYLVTKGIIHRDLAARNILVDHNKLCKIADFGMSRNVRDTGQIYEQRPNRGALPIRWMAPESLQFCLFTHKADVWSFGILLWEIITLGSTPYATMGAREVIRRVKEGYRLERPKHCKPELYKVAAKCWNYDSSKRPTFSELRQDLAALLGDKESGGGYVDLEALAEEANEINNHN